MIIEFTAIPIITAGNFPFCDKVILDTCSRLLTFRKRNMNIIGNTTRSIRFSDIAEVQLIHRQEWLTFSRINIITRGGSVLSISGLKPDDGKELKYMLDNMR